MILTESQLAKKVIMGNRAQLVEASIMLAVSAFNGMNRIGNSCPAIIHSLRVGLELERENESTTIVVSGILHDVLEDTSIRSGVIERVFGDEVPRLILACSHNQTLYEEDRKRGNKDLFRRARLHGADAIKIKVVDITDNLNTITEVPLERQEEMLFCANRWLQLSIDVLGIDSPYTARLDASVNQMKGNL
jgi:GTP pyrophosphokinase